MDETLRKQIDAWTETDEHGRIVDMLGQISPEERDSEATGLLARAYDNLGEYEKALPFRKRVRTVGSLTVVMLLSLLPPVRI